ncbi:unnamed protein product, partial [Mesorhabditis spiculigera]
MVRFFWQDVHPTFGDRLRIMNKKRPPSPKKQREDKEKDQTAFRRTRATRRSVRGSLRSGYAFSHSQGFGDLIVKGKLFKNIENMRSKSPRGPTTSSGIAPVVDREIIEHPMLSPIEEQPTPRQEPPPMLTTMETTFPVTRRRESTSFVPPPGQHNLVVNQEQPHGYPGLITARDQPGPSQGVRITGDGRPVAKKGKRTETQV